MTERGFDYRPFPFADEQPFSRREMFGIIDVEDAREFGYHNPDAKLALEVEREWAEVQDFVDGAGEEYLAALNGAPDSCSAKARRRLYGNDSSPSQSAAALQVLQLSSDAESRVARDPRIAEAVDVWRDCMSSAGFTVEVLSDTRLQFDIEPTDTSPPSTRERDLAVADATCRHDSGVDKLLVSLYSAALDDLMQQHPELRESLEADIDRAEASARAVLDESEVSSDGQD